MIHMNKIAPVLAVFIIAFFCATVGFAAVMPEAVPESASSQAADIPIGLGILFGLGALGLTINQSVLTEVFRGLQVLAMEAFQSATPIWPKLAMKIPSNVTVQVYKWIAEMARMREWISERELSNLKAHEFTITNKDWELTIPVARNDILFDNLGIYNPMAQMLGIAAAEHPDDLLIKFLVAGGSASTTFDKTVIKGTCYDGQYFFDTDHPRMNGKSVQSNKGTKILSSSSYGVARAAMRGITDERGRSMKIQPNLLVVSPTYEEVGKQILESQFLYNISADAVRVMSDNPHRNTAELLVLNELADYPNYWYLFDTSKPIKPLVYQEAKAPDFQSFVTMLDEHVFKNKEYLYGVDSIDNMGYALWQLGYFSDGTTD